MKPLKQRTMTKPQFDVILTCLTWEYSLFSELIGRSIENPVDRAMSFPHVKNLILPSLRIDALQEKW